jgi:spore coat polysaccharide biosynthesis predicted glycosyltransferase SpsG
VNRIYVDAYKNYGLGHLIRSKTIAGRFGKYKTEINTFLAKRSDVSIIDSYHAKYLHYRNISSLSEISLFIDDFNRLEYPEGILVNFSFNAKKTVKQKKTYNLLGIDYVPVRKEFLETKKKPGHILIVLGGTDIRGLSSKIENISLPYPKLVVTANRKIAKQCRNVLFNPPVKKLAEAYANSIIAVSAAGMTLYELNYLQIPTIAVKVAKNQNGVYEFVKRGFIKDVFEYDDINLMEKLKKSLFWHLNNYDLALKYTKRLIDGYGVERIYQKVMEKI